jgi:hypothetical protein
MPNPIQEWRLVDCVQEPLSALDTYVNGWSDITSCCHRDLLISTESRNPLNSPDILDELLVPSMPIVCLVWWPSRHRQDVLQGGAKHLGEEDGGHDCAMPTATATTR